ncbi:hypothetical protein [Agrobacterium vitis]|uniref:Uncharacterized protein n=1 Tax=Agrobacterium vitis TaxID=373 RepID=A0A7K1RKC2_AGRVI|nr:hypothetical protein [Agrobacterium vitis]MVA58476.1 hypothetical protein [Agrobacterium vitis]
MPLLNGGVGAFVKKYEIIEIIDWARCLPGRNDMGVALRAGLSAALKPAEAVFTLRAFIPDARRDGGGGHFSRSLRSHETRLMACSVYGTAT